MQRQKSPEHVAALRIRRCFNTECNSMFGICPCCDRGQRYCSDVCRQRVRRAQVAAAGRRYQASEAGKAKHRQRQSEYRERLAAPSVTHQPIVSVTTPKPSGIASLTQCLVCGRINLWHHPFEKPPHRIFRRWFPRGRPSVQISTFSDDR